MSESPKYVGPVEAVKLFFSNYTNFKGRSTRSEYWWAALLVGVVSCVLYVPVFSSVQSGGNPGILGILYSVWSLATLVPSLSANWRRLHDIGKSGIYILINFIPVVGSILYLLQVIKPSAPQNEWGSPAQN